MMKEQKRFFLSTMYIMGMTTLHHFYGAVIYPQIFRAYVALGAIAIGFLEYMLYRLHLKKKEKLSGVLFQLIACIVPVLMIGFYEGGYNHVLKNILFFSGADRNVLTKLFPPPEYEMPDNFLFECTGILQFVLAVMALIFFIRWKRSARTAG
ncbi:MAG TPA: hypothetical protein VHE34_26165 [Puia sp.]|uniref:hypothetical protein n=1 Tax=Puia sp. TaxID=2045100 RepID=UPI002B670193|nr:hypothetical protein [Puia sp.]HVU98745.1 hypothetical protein [Puia sp.]